MDRNIYDNEFEEFLKQKSDQYKMYPSDRVWNNVYSSLHGRKKWWALGFSLFFMGAGLLVGKEVLLSNYNKVASQVNQGADSFSSAKTAVKNNIPSAISQQAHTALIKSSASRIGAAASKTIQAPTGKNNTAANTNGSATAFAPLVKPVTAEPEKAVANSDNSVVIENDPTASITAADKNAAIIPVIINGKPLTINDPLTAKDKSLVKQEPAPINQVENAAATTTIKTSIWSLQLYASPTISYRRLSTVNQQTENTVIPVAPAYAGNINRYVRHKPAPGFEIGSNVQYKLSDNLTVFAGAQLNYSRYYIDAFKYRTEKASIAVNNAMVRDTLSGYTDIRNFNGYAPEQLQNKYLQLSVPVGVEIKLLGHKKLQFSVAGGVQPTFLLSSTSYLISSDYKNYIQSPDLARGFNVHTNFEAFISYQAAGLKWQVGPQFRSQLLSSYSNQYRVREYLTEYGIKFGVSKSF